LKDPKFRFKAADFIGTPKRNRPETPKINLLEIQQKRHKRQVTQLFEHTQQLITQQKIIGIEAVRKSFLEPLPRIVQQTPKATPKVQQRQLVEEVL
jgi:hypothetical protein